MSKKRIILILLLVVAAFIAWRKGLFAKLFGNGGSTAVTGSTPSGTNPVVVTTTTPEQFNQELKSFMARQDVLADKLGLTGSVKEEFLALVRNIYVWCHDDNEEKWSAAETAVKARNNGFTLDQQYALNAIWAMSPEGWSEAVIDKATYNEIVKRLKTM